MNFYPGNTRLVQNSKISVIHHISRLMDKKQFLQQMQKEKNKPSFYKMFIHGLKNKNSVI